MLLKNGLILQSDFQFHHGSLTLQADIITDGAYDGDTLDLDGMYVLPGLVDTHFHGCLGVNCDDGTVSSVITAREYAASCGVTTLVPTTRTITIQELKAALSAIKEASSQDCFGAKIGGIHLEGPYISKEYKGAQNEENILPPSIGSFSKLLGSDGGDLIRIISLAPEIKGALPLIQYAVECGIAVSVGHTSADRYAMLCALKYGATRLTHTFNAMPPLHHREPGVLGLGLTDNRIHCELICDLLHVCDEAVKLVFQVKPEDNVTIISDSVSAAGLPDGEYIGDSGHPQYKEDGVVRLADGTIAGGSFSVLDGIRNVVSLGIPLERAVKSATMNPARAIGMQSEIGSTSAGKKADLILLDQDLNLKYTFVDGKLVYKAD